MTLDRYMESLKSECPPPGLSLALAALWWDAKGDWHQAHALIDDVEERDAMAVHAYLHRKEGSTSNADYWYERSGTDYRQPSLEQEWETLVSAFPQRKR